MKYCITYLYRFEILLKSDSHFVMVIVSNDKLRVWRFYLVSVYSHILQGGHVSLSKLTTTDQLIDGEATPACRVQTHRRLDKWHINTYILNFNTLLIEAMSDADVLGFDTYKRKFNGAERRKKIGTLESHEHFFKFIMILNYFYYQK